MSHKSKFAAINLGSMSHKPCAPQLMLVPLDIPSIPSLLPDWMIGLMVALHFMKPYYRFMLMPIDCLFKCLYIYIYMKDSLLSQDSLLTFLFLFNFLYGLCQTYWVLH
jgi:hypothetical protein